MQFEMEVPFGLIRCYPALSWVDLMSAYMHYTSAELQNPLEIITRVLLKMCVVLRHQINSRMCISTAEMEIRKTIVCNK